MTHLELLTLNYLLNSLWQIPVIFLAASLAARLTSSAGPHIEYRIWVAALLLEATLPACAFVPSLRGLIFSLFHSRTGYITTQTTIIDVAPVRTHPAVAIFASAALAVYIASLCFFTARLLIRLYRTRALHRAAQSITLTGEPLAIWHRLARLFDIPNADLATSTAITGPSTIGIRRRVILLPPTMLSSLTHEDLAAALAHEFAHMRRRDFAKNLVYELVALPIAFHPLLWLTRPRIAESREMLCDEIAAEATHGSTRYAHSLLRLAASCARPAPAATVHAIGILDANVLERRVMKLTRMRPTAATSRRIATAGVLLLGAATCATAMTLRLEVPAPALLIASTPPPAATPIASGHQQSNGPVRIAGGVAAGQIISKVNPVYPAEAKEQGIQGAVVLHAIIDRDGTIKELAIVSGPEQLQASAIEAVRQWVYKPYLLNGEPVEVETTITVNYSLGNSAPPPTPQSTENTNSSAAGVYKIGGSVRPPVLTYSRDPEYPESARAASLSGDVIVSLIVDQDGLPRDVQVAKGMGNEFDEKAVEAVKQYRFKPATQNGEPVPVDLKIEVNFRSFK